MNNINIAVIEQGNERDIVLVTNTKVYIKMYIDIVIEGYYVFRSYPLDDGVALVGDVYNINEIAPWDGTTNIVEVLEISIKFDIKSIWEDLLKEEENWYQAYQYAIDHNNIKVVELIRVNGFVSSIQRELYVVMLQRCGRGTEAFLKACEGGYFIDD